MNIIKHIQSSFAKGTKTSRLNIIYASLIGASGHFTLYFVYRYVFSLHWENLPIRLVGVFLCCGSLYRLIKPDFLGRHFGVYWHLMLIYVLPFIITLFALKNNFDEPWTYWEIFMVFVLISFVPNWSMFLFDLIAGIVAAFAAYLLITPITDRFQTAAFDPGLYGIVVGFSIIAGYLFNYSNLQGLRAEEQRKAEEKYSALEALAGGIAHEMRNPLGQISHNLDEITQEILTERYDDKRGPLATKDLQAIRQRLTQAKTAVNRGLHIIDMTLENFRSEELFRHDFASLSIAAATRKAIDEYGYASEEERGKIDLQEGEDFIFRGDESSYMFVIYNLFLNAFHVLRDRTDGRIRLHFEPGKEMNTVIVRDNGPGIPPEFLNRIFDPFFTSGKTGGTGLGLAFCIRVMRSFGGDITCNSEPGRFTEFVLSFPALGKELIDEFEKHLYGANRTLLEGKKLLLAGNDKSHLSLIRQQLAPLGMIIDEATDGASAMNIIATGMYDLILADIELPILNAAELASRITARGKEIPVIAFAVGKDPSVGRKIEENRGIEAHISMPPVLSELLHVLKCTLETSRGVLKGSLAGKTVLVVDDLDFNRKVITSMLGRLDVTILEASNGQEALELLETNKCDLLVMDLKMPVLDGFEATRRVRRGDTPYRDIPILGLSGNLDNNSMQMARLCGINDCLIKPVKLKLFLQKVGSMLKSEKQQAA
ncbi:MAG: response regulator [Chlorobiaceae bacterium]|nr:response regulator [Chlorobiaceae bacterium]